MTPTEPLNARDAKAAAKAAKAYAKAQRPIWKKKRVLLPVAFIVIGGAIAASAGGKDDKKDDGGARTLSGNTSHKPVDDVVVDSCEYEDTIGTVTAHLTITNHTSKRSNYIVTLNVETGAGVKVSEITAASNNVEAGQTAKEDGLGSVSGGKPEGMKCVVKEVNRFASV